MFICQKAQTAPHGPMLDLGIFLDHYTRIFHGTFILMEPFPDKTLIKVDFHYFVVSDREEWQLPVFFFGMGNFCS